jgi:hypothetical protein
MVPCWSLESVSSGRKGCAQDKMVPWMRTPLSPWFPENGGWAESHCVCIFFLGTPKKDKEHTHGPAFSLAHLPCHTCLGAPLLSQE